MKKFLLGFVIGAGLGATVTAVTGVLEKMRKEFALSNLPNQDEPDDAELKKVSPHIIKSVKFPASAVKKAEDFFCSASADFWQKASDEQPKTPMEGVEDVQSFDMADDSDSKESQGIWDEDFDGGAFDDAISEEDFDGEADFDDFEGEEAFEDEESVGSVMTADEEEFTGNFSSFKDVNPFEDAKPFDEDPFKEEGKPCLDEQEPLEETNELGSSSTDWFNGD